MHQARTTLVVSVTASLVCWAVPLVGQVGADSKACKLVSVPEFETHFGGKSISVRGSDTATTSMCSVRVNDIRHQASLEVHPPSPTDQTVSPQQRIEVVARVNKGRPLESKIFGSVGCFKANVDMGDKPLPSTVCFQSPGGYIALTIASDDPKHTTFDAVKALLEKVVARRK